MCQLTMVSKPLNFNKVAKFYAIRTVETSFSGRWKVRLFFKGVSCNIYNGELSVENLVEIRPFPRLSRPFLAKYL